MTDRYTRKDAEKALRRLCAETGREYGYVPGGWWLDYAPVYGGCNVSELMPEGSGERQPFGPQRVSPREFCDRIRFSLTLLNEARSGIPA